MYRQTQRPSQTTILLFIVTRDSFVILAVFISWFSPPRKLFSLALPLRKMPCTSLVTTSLEVLVIILLFRHRWHICYKEYVERLLLLEQGEFARRMGQNFLFQPARIRIRTRIRLHRAPFHSAKIKWLWLMTIIDEKISHFKEPFINKTALMKGREK